jgi:hypothetical protein
MQLVFHTRVASAARAPHQEIATSHAHPIEPNPPPRLGLEASGWSVSASVLKEAVDGRAKVAHSPRQSRDGAHHRKDQGHVTTSCPEGHGQGTGAATRATLNPEIWPLARILDSVRREDPAAEIILQNRRVARLGACRMIVEQLARDGSLRAELEPTIAADLLWALRSLARGKTWCSSVGGPPRSTKNASSPRCCECSPTLRRPTHRAFQSGATPFARRDADVGAS